MIGVISSILYSLLQLHSKLWYNFFGSIGSRLTIVVVLPHSHFIFMFVIR